MDFPGETPFAIARDHIVPGRMDIRVLDQADVWVDVRAVVHSLAEMDTAYQLNLLLFLREHATDLHLKVLLANVSELARAALTGQPGPEPADLEQSDLVWLESTVLYRALHTLTGSGDQDDT